MKKYKAKVSAVFMETYEIEAKNEQEAIKKAEGLIKHEIDERIISAEFSADINTDEIYKIR